MITDNTGAKKIEGTDNWRLIFDAHNDSVDAHSQAIQQIATVITGTTNNSGHAISANEYFIADGAKYKASQTIDTGATWAGKCTSVSDHDLINALNSKIANICSYISDTKTTDEYGNIYNVIANLPAGAKPVSIVAWKNGWVGMSLFFHDFNWNAYVFGRNGALVNMSISYRLYYIL